MIAICKVDGCDRPVKTREWCSTHYYYWRKYGDPEHPRIHARPITAEAISKVCPKCGKNKLLGEYRTRKSGPRAGFPHCWCKECETKKARARNEACKQREPSVEGERECLVCHRILPITEFHISRSSNQGRTGKCRGCHRTSDTATRYGISIDEVHALHQVTVCQIPACNVELAPGQATHIDHSHTSGRIRGVLCRGCNLALGHARENPTLLRSMADYLEGLR